jgi:hypothetical protein
MTSDEGLKAKLSPVHIVASVVGTIAVSFIMSFLGTAGTLIGLAVGSLLSTTFPAIFEHFGTHGMEAARKRARKRRAAVADGTMTLTAARAEARADAARARQPFLDKIHWRVLGISAAVVAIASVGAITAVEAGVGKPVTDIVRNARGTGLTLTGGGGAYTPPPYTPPAFTPSPDISPDTPPQSPTPSTSPSAPDSSPASTPPPPTPTAAPGATSPVPSASTPAPTDSGIP